MVNEIVEYTQGYCGLRYRVAPAEQVQQTRELPD